MLKTIAIIISIWPGSILAMSCLTPNAETVEHSDTVFIGRLDRHQMNYDLFKRRTHYSAWFTPLKVFRGQVSTAQEFELGVGYGTPPLLNGDYYLLFVTGSDPVAGCPGIRRYRSIEDPQLQFLLSHGPEHLSDAPPRTQPKPDQTMRSSEPCEQGG